MNSAQLLDRTPGLSYRQLDCWVRQGYLHECRYKAGSGHPREFTGDEARVAQTMARLVAAGLTPRAAHTVARGQAELAPGITVHIEESHHG